MTLLRLLAGIMAGGAVGGFVGDKTLPKPIFDIEMIPFLPNKAMTVQYYNQYPGRMLGMMIGGVIGAIISTRFMNKASHSMGQAQPMNNGSVQVAVTWANGHTMMIGEEEIVQGEHLMEYVANGVIQVAEDSLGQNAASMFPAKLEVMHGNEFYQGSIDIDEEGMPELKLNNISVKRPEYSAKNADRKNAKRTKAAKQAIETANANKIPLQPGVQPNDFTIPIPD